MFPGSTKGGGQCVATGPDVCKVPTPGGPVPTPLPNIAQCPQCTGTATDVKFSGELVIIKGSNMPTSNGDNAGTLMGMTSGTVMGECLYNGGSNDVKIGGKECMRQTSQTGMNGGSNANVPGNQPAPSQTGVKVT
jgi:hypothetical protein